MPVDLTEARTVVARLERDIGDLRELKAARIRVAAGDSNAYLTIEMAPSLLIGDAAALDVLDARIASIQASVDVREAALDAAIVTLRAP